MTDMTDMRAAAIQAREALKARFGTYAEAARELEISPQALHDWVKQGRVSHRQARRVAALIGVPVSQLRPDLYGD